MRHFTAIFLFLLIYGLGFAQKSQSLPKPKLVVGIVIDQMRYDFLYRYYDLYSEKGFKRLMREGFNCRNNHYHYATTYTGPGHAAIYTGSVPAINGIVGNEWYELSGKLMYVAEDSTVQGIGTDSKAGKMSPRNLLTSTITDQLRLASNFRSKVIGVAIKDRGAILPAGHSANAAYWYDSQTGNWVSSSFYMQKLPDWVEKFNASGRAKALQEKTWETLLPISQYIQSEADEQSYERNLEGENKPIFPHKINSFSALTYTPFGNTLTKEFALAAFRNENLGKSGETDFLCVSFSSPDIGGHTFGPYSIETQDMYLRLDLEIAEMLETFDKELGKNNYLVFLTADHGVADIPAFLKKHKIPAGISFDSYHLQEVQTALEKKFGEGKWILYTENQQLYLNHKLLDEKNVSVKQIYEIAKKTLLHHADVYSVVNLWDNDIASALPTYYAELVKNIYHPKRSGEIMILLKPAYFYGFAKGGTTHGTFYNYDTHVPLLWFGWQIPQGETFRRTHIADIAPTLASFLNILPPNGNIGEPILEILSKKK
jgi:predicted AlkP superfamily pyrophosphatase or phosphodiesterase